MVEVEVVIKVVQLVQQVDQVVVEDQVEQVTHLQLVLLKVIQVEQVLLVLMLKAVVVELQQLVVMVVLLVLFQAQVVMVPVDASVNVTSNGAMPVVTEPEKAATGAGCETEIVHWVIVLRLPSETITIRSWSPVSLESGL